ncbi:MULTISPECIES: hypothetical protein [unclassified Halomonas]|uniref:hypothetical protein n=1 Tax=unclassified Halomonas TaxID=2609666 RepID=UPI0007D8E556|nr:MULTISPECIES: hypothetical protein [unclassified Halomonas]MBT2788032.1 hypothetical protein [Halomonas sp. ISL-106]MBT2795781.1 hypothetical protein [Halomonas sp. ISL-104]OAL61074.1 hypothetical protein A6R74_15845 [Halomonas sp. ALS9]
MISSENSPAVGATTGEAQGNTSHENNSAVSASLTIITSTKPARLTKSYQLADDGELLKDTGGDMVQGRAAVYSVDSLATFARLLQSLKPNQALVYGRPERRNTRLVSKSRWLESGRPDDPIPRSKEHFSWPAGAGMMMADYDPGTTSEALSCVDLMECLHAALPALADVAALWWPSSSSHIVNNETGDDLTGLRGQRLYWLALDARDIERAGRALQVYFWAAGHGWVDVGAAGQRLKRTLLDASVWQSNRLDFAAGAECFPPLVQQRGEPVLVGGAVAVLDTQAVIPDPDPVTLAAAEKNKVAAMLAAKLEADTVQADYIEARAREMVGSAASDETLEQSRETVRRALNNNVLAGDFPIMLVDENGSKQVLTVGDVLDNPERYHNFLTLDPIEPEYQGGKTVGKLYLMSAHPSLYSFSHGGKTYKLSRPPVRVELVKGRTFDVVEQVLVLMRRAPDVYDFGGPLVTATDGRVYPLDEHALKHWLGGSTQFWRWHKLKNGEHVEVLEDPPVSVAKILLSLGERRALKRLNAIITAPTLRIDGSLLNLPGFDEATGLLLEIHSEEMHPVPTHPTGDEVGTALKRLMMPFTDFPLVGAVDRGVLLAALLTAAVRPVLPTAPAVGFDAPAQGSGKTLLAKCVAVLALGEVPTIWPHTHARDDEEIRKRIMTILMTGTRAVIWDNVIGVFDSAALAGALTSENYSDRILGKTGSANVPNKALWLLTGNNLTLAGDLPRRVLKCRIDPEMDSPFARQFDVDPEAYCQQHRQRMIADALTVIRGWLASNDAPAPGKMASFEAWDTLVRQTVAWVARHVDPSGQYADPMEAVNAAQAADPEQEQLDALLCSLADVFGSDPFTAKDVKKIHDNYHDTQLREFYLPDPEQTLAEAITEFKNAKHLTTRGVGSVFKYRADRVVNGKRLRKRSGRGGVAAWVIETV